MPKGKQVPILIYGASSTVSAFILEFAKLNNLTRIITIPGGGADFVKSLNAAGYTVDYRKKNVAADVKKIFGKQNVKLYHAFDAVSEHHTWRHAIEILD